MARGADRTQSGLRAQSVGLLRQAVRVVGIAVGVIAGLVLLAVISYVGYGLIAGARAVPDHNGDALIAGVGEPVEIIRDARAVPHIYAKSEADAWFGLGYAHASDRLWQMDVLRRVAKGEVAAAAGSLAVPVDTAMRTLGLARRAERDYVRLSPETKTLLRAYAAGINAYVETSGKPLPPEFQFAWLDFAPWRPEDSVALTKLLGLGLSMDGFSELRRLALGEVLTPLQLDQFNPPYPDDAPVTLRESAAERATAIAGPRLAAANGFRGSQRSGEEHAIRRPVAGLGWLNDLIAAQGASNAWAVSPERTTTGKPLLATDPHLGLFAPSVWYLAHLAMPDRNLVGASIPGIPSILMGRNDHIAWGFTTTRADVQDIYRERLNPDNEGEYQTPDGFDPFETFTETIPVRFGEDVEITVRETRHGVVLPDLLPAVREAEDRGEVLALAWPLLDEGDKSVEAGIALTRARNWEELNAAMRDYVGPVQNLVYADIGGHIGFLTVGHIPARRADHDSYGLAPVRGWLPRNDWVATIPFTLAPRGFDPPTGFFINANNKVVPDTYPFLVSNDWDTPFRARRIEEVIENGPADAESFRALQMDNRSAFAVEILPHLTHTEPTSEMGRRMLARLAAWDGTMEADATEPLVFYAWLRTFSEALYRDELKGAYSPGIRPLFLLEVLSNRKGAAVWCDNQETAARETCADLLATSLETTLTELKAEHGNDPYRWRWGEVHPALNRHIPGSFIPGLAHLVTIKRPSSGANDTVNRGQMSIGSGEPFANIHAGGYRAVYDFSDLNASLYMSATGQSGNPFSAHWDDLADGWVEGTAFPIETDRERVTADSLGTFVLKPKGEEARQPDA